MKIDIILPTYNRRAFLPKAIEGIRAQTFRDWRLLIVNDGGEDVGDIVRAAGDPRIVYFDRPHAGKAAQLNFALSQATADYIAYMDDDDEVYPEHLEKLLSAAETYDADFVYSDTYLTLLDAQGNVEWRRPENVLDAPWEEIRIFNRVNHKQILHTRTLAERVGPYDEAMRVLIDYDFIKRLAQMATRPYHLREITGDHFLRRDPKTGEWSSITGLWTRDPAAAGESLLRFFAKDPAALAGLYQLARDQRKEIEDLSHRLGRTLGERLKRLFRRRRGDSCALHEVLSVPGRQEPRESGS